VLSYAPIGTGLWHMLIYGGNIPSKYLILQTKVQDMSYEMTGWNERVRFLSTSARHCVFKNTRETVPLMSIPIPNGAQQSLAHYSFTFYPVLPTTVWFHLPSIFNLCTCKKTALSAPRDPNLTKKFVNSRWKSPPLRTLFASKIHFDITSNVHAIQAVSFLTILRLWFCTQDLR
jgi:hypothetical protein